MLRDLSSTSLPDVQMGLGMAPSLATAALAASLLERVLPLAGHTAAQVRTRALAVLQHLCSLDPALWGAGGAVAVSRALSDPSPGVVGAAVQAAAQHATAAEADAALGAAFHLLEQLEGGKLPAEFTYRGHAAPFLRCQVHNALQWNG